MFSCSIRVTRVPASRKVLAGLAVAALLGLVLASPPSAHATTYSVKATFNEGKFNSGIAVDQSSDELYVTNLYEPVGKYDSSGNALNGGFTSQGTQFGGPNYAGLALDPLTRDVFINSVGAFFEPAEKIQTFTPPGETPIRSLDVSGDGFGKWVQIASNASPMAGGAYPSGSIFYPNREAKEIQVFAGTAEGSAAASGLIKGAGSHELIDPTSVAVDSAHESAYVVDSGSVQVFNPEPVATGGTWLSTLEEGGAQDVAVDPVSGDVFVLDRNGQPGCGALPEPCYRVHAYRYGETTPFAEFGQGVIKGEGFAELPDRLAVDHKTESVYVADAGNGGEGSGKVWIFQPGIPPEAKTDAATGVTASQATLSGEVNPKGNETFYHFEYGTTTSYGASVPVPDALVGEGGKFKPQSATVSGLEANTEYHFRLVARTASGETVDGADLTFTTTQAPPVVVAGSALASGVTQTDALLNATINPQHLDTHYYFNYSRAPLEDSSGCTPPSTVPYATAPATPLDIGEGTGPEAVSLDLATASVVLHPGMETRALAPNTAYHFQVVAENAAGTSCQAEAAFITLPPSPVAGTGAVSGITQTTANLTGTVTPGSTGPNSDTTWYFEYGASAGYGLFAPANEKPREFKTVYGPAPMDVGMGAGAVPVAAALEELAPNTTYDYRLLASNANGDAEAKECSTRREAGCAPQVAQGQGRTFTTLPLQPFVGQPSNITSDGATLTGDVSPSGHKLEYRFEYGHNTTYGQTTALASAGEGGGHTPVTSTLSGLARGTYHYRLGSIGAGGESYSSDAIFTLDAHTPPQAADPFPVGSSAGSSLATFSFLSAPGFPSAPTGVVVPASKSRTTGRRLARALKHCGKLRGARRKSCTRRARMRH